MLRAVDVQQVLLQTTSVERIQQTQQQQSDLQQRYVAVLTNEEKKLLQQKLKESNSTEKVRIQREEERERKRKMTRDHRKAEGKPLDAQGEEIPSGKQTGGRINIRV